MKYLLDTDSCIYLLKRSSALLAQRLVARPSSEVCISAISVAELWYGAAKSGHPRTADRLRAFLDTIPEAPFDAISAKAAGEVRAELERAGTPIGPHDTLIAGHARELRATLITHNVKEFQRVKGIKLADWTA